MAKYVKSRGKSGSAKIEKHKKSVNFKSKNKGKVDGKKKNFSKKKKNLPNKKHSNIVKKKKPNEESDITEGTKGVKDHLKRKLLGQESNSTKEKKEKPDIIPRLMSIYELLRKKKSSKEDKHKLVDEVIKFVNEKENQVVFKHDTVRVLEICMKYGTSDQRGILFELFKEKTTELITSKYSKFLVKKFMEYGSKDQKGKIIASFYGKVRKLMKHKGAADILEELYAKHANATQRAALVEEFYGPEFTIYKIATGQTFEHMIENEPAKKEAVMNFMKNEFTNLCQKDLILHSITHKALFEFFKYSDDKQKSEVRDILKEKIIHILHTKEGAKVAMNCLWFGTTKDRKLILKSFKTYVAKICKEEFGHLVILSLFDVVDDTVLVKKALFPEILSNLKDLIDNQYGRKVILYLLKPRSPSYFLPDIVKILEEGDNNPYSKKNQEVRREELRSGILTELLIALSPHVNDIIRNKSVAIVLLAAIDCSKDCLQLESLFKEICIIVTKSLKNIEDEGTGNTKKNDNDPDEHPICNACGHWVIKSIIKKDKEKSAGGYRIIFSNILCDMMPDGDFADWALFNRGAFVLVSLMETEIETVKTRVENDLTLLPSDRLSSGDGKGIELLRQLLSN